jgi:hypothetical protein
MHNQGKKHKEVRRQDSLPVEAGKEYSAKVCHDTWCQLWAGGRCNCNPDISWVEITDKNRAEVAAAVARDTAQFRNILRLALIGKRNS